jgi:hypothetical protein
VLEYAPPGLDWQGRDAARRLDSVPWPVVRAAGALVTSGALARLPLRRQRMRLTVPRPAAMR